ncbi:MAG: alkaline phosphatase D family protein [Thermoleophilaceae bacterium]
MPALVLGPLLRYVGETEAVVWVETDATCRVELLGSSERTFCVAGHHYGLVRAEGLEPGTWHEYEVALDGERVWPERDSPFPPSRFRTYPKDGPLVLAFGSCRVAAPNEPPWTLTGDESPEGLEVDALHALATRMKAESPERWPDALLMLGDQVYADEPSPQTRAFLEGRRDASEPPGDCVYDFEEYARLYREAWSEPAIRWLLSTVSTAMVWDDHDVHDDWNISLSWLEEARRHHWWDEHIVAAISTYWIYQHLGNLAPEAHSDDELLARVRAAGDGEQVLRDFAVRADRRTDGSRWSYCRDLGETRIVVIDSRAGRVLEPGRRSMVDEGEWDWITEHATGGYDHLVIGTSLPWLLAPGMHYGEAFSEALSEGAWGSRLAPLGERLRESLDMEHWAAFQRSFEALSELQRSVAAGERGTPPASIVTLSGDVHHAYLSEVAFPRGSKAHSSVWQAVCSPFRHPLDDKERNKVRVAGSRAAAAATRSLARMAGVSDPPVRWRMVDGSPWFDNVVGTLRIEGRRMDLSIEKSLPGARLETVLEQRLA